MLVIDRKTVQEVLGVRVYKIDSELASKGEYGWGWKASTGILTLSLSGVRIKFFVRKKEAARLFESLAASDLALLLSRAKRVTFGYPLDLPGFHRAGYIVFCDYQDFDEVKPLVETALFYKEESSEYFRKYISLKETTSPPTISVEEELLKEEGLTCSCSVEEL